MSIDKERELIRAAGGIVHSDGNIFFTNYEKFLEAARAAVDRASLEAVPDGRAPSVDQVEADGKLAPEAVPRLRPAGQLRRRLRRDTVLMLSNTDAQRLQTGTAD